MARAEHRPVTVLDKVEASVVNRQNLPVHIQHVELSQTYAHQKGEAPKRETLLDASEGFQPYGPPKIYTGDVGHSYPEFDTSTAEAYLRERFKLGPESEIVFGSAGSDEILERICISFKDDTTLWGIGPHFPDFINKTKVIRRPKHIAISPDFSAPLDDILADIAKKIKQTKKKKLPSAIYLANPDARGEFAHGEKLAKFIDQVTAQGIMVILDNAYSDFLPDEESVSNLTSNNSYLIVTSSLSKGVGLPGEGLAYMIAHKSYAEEYRRQLRNFSHRGASMNLLNKLMNKEVMNPHLAMVRERTKRMKSKLMQALSDNGIHFLKTSELTPNLIVDGGDDAFWYELDLPTTPGNGYSATYERVVPSVDLKTLSNRYVRVGLPLLDYDDPNVDEDEAIAIIIKRILGAKFVIEQNRRNIRELPIAQY